MDIRLGCARVAVNAGGCGIGDLLPLRVSVPLLTVAVVAVEGVEEVAVEGVEAARLYSSVI